MKTVSNETREKKKKKGTIDVTRVYLTKRIMTFFLTMKKVIFPLNNSMTDESIRFRVFFVLDVNECVLHLKFTVFSRSFFFEQSFLV